MNWANATIHPTDEYHIDIALVAILLIKNEMLALINSPLKPICRPIPDGFSPAQIGFEQQMTSRHSCPCCASVLLRHISQGNVYWRCSHCRAAMAVWAQL